MRSEYLHQSAQRSGHILRGRFHGTRATKTSCRCGCFRTGFGFFGLSLGSVAIARSIDLVESLLFHAATDRIRQSVLHHGRFHHRRRRRVAATAQKTERTVHRNRMLDLLSDRTSMRHGRRNVRVSTAGHVRREWILLTFPDVLRVYLRVVGIRSGPILRWHTRHDRLLSLLLVEDLLDVYHTCHLRGCLHLQYH